MHNTEQTPPASPIFRAYDIRGVYPDQINETIARQIGVAFARYIKKNEGVIHPHILVSRDARPSSPVLAAAFMEGLFAEGARVTDAGLTTTPMHYFGVYTLGADGGAMITASHNPPLYNGMKLSGKAAVPIGAGSGLEEIARLLGGVSTMPTRANGAPAERHPVDLIPSYVDHLITLLHNPGKHAFAGVHVAVDAGNGMAGLVLPYVFERLGIAYDPLYFEVDGAMPHHEANPAKEATLEDLRALMRENSERRGTRESTAIGVAFDGDGDRVGFLTHRGEHIRGDIVVGILGVDVVREHPGAGVVYTIVSSRLISEAIVRAGGRAIKSRVGSRFVPEAMREHGALFGGEYSGHYFFKEFFYRESAILTMLKMLRLLTRQGRNLEELALPFQTSAYCEISFPIVDGGKSALIEKVAAQFAEHVTDRLDGVTVEFPDWWFNVRASNTEPLTRLVIEAPDDAALEEKKQMLAAIIEK